MFAGVKKSGRYEYLQIVHNQRIDGTVRQQVIATLGHLDQLRESGQLDSLLRSYSKFSEHAAVLMRHNEAMRNRVSQFMSAHP